MDHESVLDVVAGPASSSVAEHALDASISTHENFEIADFATVAAAAAAATSVVKTAPPTNDTFERVDSVMNEDDDATAAAAGRTTTAVTTLPPPPPPPTTEGGLASAIPSVASVMPAVKATDVARNDAGVRILGLHEWKAASLSLAEAFEKDHSSLYFLDTPERAHWTRQQKWDLHLKIMEYITYAHLLKGLVVSAGPDYDCVGLW
nr:hypothetical protein CFP56_72082 [Quercus suber]